LTFVDADALPSFCEMAASSALQRVIVVTEQGAAVTGMGGTELRRTLAVRRCQALAGNQRNGSAALGRCLNLTADSV
jgi:hypothetical protein